MFEQLRIKVAIRQTVTLSVMLIFVLSLIYVFNYSRMLMNIDDSLQNVPLSAISDVFLDRENSAMEKNPRDTMLILVDNNGDYYISGTSLYDNAIVESIVDYTLACKDDSGRIRVDGNYVAYRRNKGFKVTAIVIYDYTSEFTSLRNTGIIIVLVGIIGIIVIALFSFQSAKKSVVPIENAFNKQQDLVANASHELKTPLTIINTDLSILNCTTDNLSDDQIKWLDSINNQVGRMSMLINEMLELAKMDAAKEKQIFEVISLSDIVEGVVLGAEALAFEHQIMFETDIARDIKINGVAQNIEKLVYILVENAIKYTNKQGVVKISVSAERKRAVFKIKNTGDGITKEDLPKLFDRFYRTDEAHSATGSFGLGLAIAKSIVDNHGATIGVDSKVGEYTEFIVLFKQI